MVEITEVNENTVNAEEEPQNREIEHLEIDTRRPEWCWDPVKTFEVCDALGKDHEDDVTKSIEPIGRYIKKMFGVFRLDTDDIDRYVGKSVEIRGKLIPITPYYRVISQEDSGPSYFPRHRKEGTLITIYGAYRRDNRHITNEAFDAIFTEQGLEIIKLTQPQFNKNTNILNNNRYLVVEKIEEGRDIGTFIKVMGIRFNIQYTGMEKYCYLCARKHGWDCPIQRRHNFLREQRKGLTDKRKIYSDSIFRNTNQLALTTDIGCMTGGGIGQVCNAIARDKKFEEVVISGGTNEILHTQSLQEYVYTIDKSVEKLKALTSETNVTLVFPTVPLSGPHEMGKAAYLEEKVKEIPEIKLLQMKDIQYESSGVHQHPTVEGTVDMLCQLNDFTDKEILLPETIESDLTARKYQHVHVLYKVGCRACPDYDGYTQDICPTCKEEAAKADITHITEIITKINDELFPTDMNVDENGSATVTEVDMKEIVKRAVDTSNENEKESEIREKKVRTNDEDL